MFSPNSPICDENRVPAARAVHRKSVGRTPLKVLNSQHLAVPDTYVNKESSLSKPASHTAPTNKDTSSTDASKPMKPTVTVLSDSETCPSQNLQPCSLFPAEVSHMDMNETPQLHSAEKHITGNEDLCIHDEECTEINTVPPVCGTNTRAGHEEHPVLEEGACPAANDLTNLLPHVTLNVCSNVTAASPHKLTTDCDLYEESVHVTVKDKSTLNVSCNSSSDYKPLTEAQQALGDTEEQICLNSTYALDVSCNDLYEQKLVTTLSEMVSDITVNIGKCRITAAEAEDGCQRVPADSDMAERSLQGEECSSYSQDSLMDDINTNPSNTSSVDHKPDCIGASDVMNEAALCVLPGSSGPGLTVKDSDVVPEALSVTPCSLEDAEVPVASAEVMRDPILTTDSGQSPPLRHSPISNMMGSLLRKNAEDVSSPAFHFPTPVSSRSRAREIPLLNSVFTKLTPRILASPLDTGTSMTPTLTSDAVTWTTPIMLLNKSINTSRDVVRRREDNAKDNASETDALLWNFSRETLFNASREELMDRLEATLIVVEVLSRQLQVWQQEKVYSKPSEQRECSTQTCVTYCSTNEEYYHNLYLKTLGKLQSMERCQEEEQKFQQMLKEACDKLVTQNIEAASLLESAENLYDVTQRDRADLSQTVSCTRALLSDHMAVLTKAKEKIQQCVQQRNEMRACMEDSVRAKEAANQCLEDLEIHSSALIASMSRDLESERQLRDAFKETCEKQLSYKEELMEFAQSAQSVCSDAEHERTLLLRQCSEARELMSQHWQLLEVMKKRTQTALGEYEEIKHERDMAILQHEQVCSHLKIETLQNDQLKLENSRLGSELESLTERLCKLESDIEWLKEENSELLEQLSAKDSSLKLLEKELNETTVRGQEYQERIKYLSTQIVPSLEMDLSEALKQKEALQTHVQKLEKDHAFQIAYYTESLEFLEQENSVCREQVAETENQLKTHHLSLLERNFQCENLKDTIKELQQELKDLQETLTITKNEAQIMRLKMKSEISDSSSEVTKIKSHLQQLISNLREATNGEAKGNSLEPHTPGRSLRHNSVLEEHMNTTNQNAADAEDQTAEGLWSKTSAFTAVLPAPSPPAGMPPVSLPSVLYDLSNVVTEVVATSANALDAKQQIIEGLNKEISFLKKEQQSENLQHNSVIYDLQANLNILKKKNCILDEKVNSKEKCISELQEVINQQEQKILQQFSKAKDSEALMEENDKLKHSLKLCENEVKVLKSEMALNPAEAARNWIQEKVLLHKDLMALRLKLVDAEHTKSETVQRLIRHKDILTENLYHSEAEVRKIDGIIEKIREVLFSVEDVDSCDTVRQLMKILK